MSTDPAVPPPVLPVQPQPQVRFDLDLGWQIHPQVAVRPERFGALLYHFGTRRLSFLKDPVLTTVVTSLGAHASARAACRAAGVGEADLANYCRALDSLLASNTICERSTP